jgi:hypothetical protein
MIAVLCTLSGCGSSGDGARPGDNGVFYGGTTETEAEAVPGLTYLSEPSKMVGFTSSGSGYTFTEGDYVTFSINGFALPMIEATPVISALSYGTPGVLDTVSRNVSILFAMLDTEPSVPGITLPDANFAAVVPPGGMTVTEFLETSSQAVFQDYVVQMFFSDGYDPGAETYQIGVTVTGLTGTLILQNNGGDDLTITTNGLHYFATEVAHGFPYDVTVGTRPAGQGVTITNGSGIVLGAEVTDIIATCQTGYVVGGTLSGFTGSRDFPEIYIENTSNGDTLVLTADGPFEFPQALFTGASYNVVITSVEDDENAVVTNGSGTIAGADVSNVLISCPGRVMIQPRNTEDNISPDGYDVGNQIGESSSTSVALDDAGNAIVVWTQTDGYNGNIMMSTYDAATSTWSHPPSATETSANRISPGDTYATHPRVGMDNLGNALIVWLQPGGQSLTNQVFVSEHKDGAWDHPDNLNDTFLNFGTATIDNLVMAMSDDGSTSYASIAWTELASDADSPSIEGYDSDVHVVTGTKANTVGASWVWSADQPIELVNDSYSSLPPNDEEEDPVQSIADSLDIAVNNTGQTILVWEELAFHGDFTNRDYTDGTPYKYPLEYNQGIFKATYNVESTGWTLPTTITNELANEFSLGESGCISGQWYEARTPVCAIDDSGDIVVLWREFTTRDPSTGGHFRPMKLEYRSGVWGGLSAAGSGYEVFKIDVDMDNNGNALVAWSEATTPVFSGEIQILRWEYRGGLWSAGLTGEVSEASTESSGPVVAMSDDDPVSAVVIWQQSDGTNRQLYLAECRGGVWDDPESLSDTFSPPGTETEVNSESAAMNALGDTVIIWSQDNGVGNKQLFMSEYR